MYDEGGHFDWDRDLTHGKIHHVTVLVALNTLWSDGGLYLRHDNNEMAVDIQPKIAGTSGPHHDVFICAPQTDPSSFAYTPGEYDFTTLDILHMYRHPFLILLGFYDSRCCERKFTHSLNSAKLVQLLRPVMIQSP